MRYLRLTAVALITALALPACAEQAETPAQAADPSAKTAAPPKAAPAAREGLKTAVFAGGCFWCVEQAFDEVEGVVETTSGYAGGHLENPSYEQVSHGNTGHLEAVKVVYDPDKVDYQRLLNNFWHNVDPTDPNGQFCDQGSSYLSAVFAQNERQERLAEASKQALQASETAPSPIVTSIRGDVQFWPAEDYHQNYYKKNPLRYKFYKTACGRVDRLEELWGKAAGKPVPIE